MSLNFSEEELKERLRSNPDLSVRSSSAMKPHPLPAFASAIEKRKNKYNAQRTEYNGVTYDSKKEAEYAQLLDAKVTACDLSYWLRQVPFDLPGGVKYRADFVTFEQVADTSLYDVHVIDAKGYQTKEFKIKAKLFRAKYGQEIELV